MPDPVPESPRVASYQADPARVGRVLLLFSGGLDTSVMVKWIQERYGAEIVTLTVDLGQPGEDYDAVVAKARDLGAVEAGVANAREEFATDYVLPAIRAATRSPTAARARATTRCASMARLRRWTPS